MSISEQFFKIESEIGKTAFNSFQVSSIQNKIPQQECITMTLLINKEEYVTYQNRVTKYNDFLQTIQQAFYQEGIQEQNLILIQGWNPIFPKSINSTIMETIQYNNLNLKVEKIFDFLREIVNKLNFQSGANKQQSIQIQSLQNELTNNAIEIQKWKDQISELVRMQNKFENDCELLKQKIDYICETMEKQKAIQEMQEFQQSSNNRIQQEKYEKYEAEKDKVEDYLAQIQQLQLEIGKRNDEIQQLKNDNDMLLKDVTQYQTQKKESQNYNELKQQQDIEHIDFENNREQKIQQNDQNSELQNNIQEIEPEQLNEQQIKQTSQNNSLMLTQQFQCFFCDLSCQQFIQLPCQHVCHEACLQQLGINACANQESSAKCICSRKISVKLFNKSTQSILLPIQAAAIFKKYQHSYSLMKCLDCEYFCISNDQGKSYCPNCFKFIIVK